MLQKLNINDLRDGNEQSVLLRQFLKECDLETIKTLIGEVKSSVSLNSQIKGFVYQDVVNNLGQRLGFDVEFGRYRGNPNALNHDGLWSGNNVKLLIETKATSSYQIDLSKYISYSIKIFEKYNLDKKPPILLVLFDENTANLEAQIRGSREDDKISVIGIDALTVLVEFAQNLGGGPALKAIQSSLCPRDYTRLDQLIFTISDVVSEIVTLSSSGESVSEKIEYGPTKLAKNKIVKKLERDGILVESMYDRFFKDTAGKKYYCYFLKRFHRKDQQYWLSIEMDVLKKIIATESDLCLALENKPFFIHFGYQKLEECRSLLNTFTRGKKEFIHLGLLDLNGDTILLLPKSKSNLLLNLYLSMY